jgi:hypothetical protein
VAAGYAVPSKFSVESSGHLARGLPSQTVNQGWSS